MAVAVGFPIDPHIIEHSKQAKDSPERGHDLRALQDPMRNSRKSIRIELLKLFKGAYESNEISSHPDRHEVNSMAKPHIRRAPNSRVSAATSFIDSCES